uniref:Serpentine receptor class gamma n=1 Tax=Panagrellus redivivus TaxID=6233 RepID=A0A7E4VL17_PANRE
MLKELAENSSDTALNAFITESSFYHFYELDGVIRAFYKTTFIVLIVTAVALLASIVYAINFVLNNRKNKQSITKAAKVLYISSLVEVFLCVTFLNGPVSVFVFSWGWNVPNTSNIVGVAISMILFHGTFDRLSTLYCIVPYRKYCISVFGCFGNTIGNIVTPKSTRLVIIRPK